MSTIPADLFVAVNPSVLAVGGSALDMITLMLTTSTRVPIGTVMSFPDDDSVGTYFGLSSDEAAKAAIYFAGFTNAQVLPGSVLFAQYNTANVGAYLRGGALSLTLTQLQALSGTLAITIDGIAKSGSPNLSAATSFSNAGTIIADALDIEGGAGASFTAAISGTTMTVSAVSAGTIEVGQLVDGAGTTAGTYISALGSGTGGTGTYTVSISQTVGSEAMTTALPGVSYDSVSAAFKVISSTTGASSTIAFATGTIADDLKLQAAQGAVLSQGALAAVPAAFMNGVVQQTTDWVNFLTLFDPDGGSGNTVKQAFAAWKNTKNDRFGYICWDPDVTPAQTLPATGSLGYILAQNGDSGTVLISAPDATLAAFAGGAAAAIAFGQPKGRTTLAFRNQAGLTASVTTEAAAVNLGGNPQVEGSFGNGYNYYGAVGSANSNFQWYQRGTVTGRFKWFDSFLNQVWWNNLLQTALLTFLGAMRSIAFDVAGAALIDQALADPIQTGLSFGAAAPGAISSAQIAQVNAEAGANVAGTLQTQGYYLQILQQPSSTRASRGPWRITLWYLDRGSVQSISLSSVAVQ